MTRPTVTSDLEWRRNTARDVRSLQRRGSGRGLGSGGLTTGLLDPLYNGVGAARVTLPGYDELTTQDYEWLTPYQPSGSRVVNLIWAGGTWRILGHAGNDELGAWRRLPTLANWTTYGITTGDPLWGDRARASLLPSGIVVLSGLIAGGTTTADTVVGILPEGMRPDTDMIFPVNNSDVARAIKLLANGEIQLSSAAVTSNYISLDGIAFPAAGVATWTPITTFANGWVDFGASRWGVARYWVDPYGVIWFAGMVKNGSTTAESTIFVLPVGARPHLEEHVAVASAELFGAIGGDTGTGNIVVKSASSSWISLGGATMLTTAAHDDLPWITPRLLNSWANHANGGTLFPLPRMVRREDGLCMTRGLIVSGTIGQTAFLVPDEMRPANRIILNTVSNSARGRADVYSTGQFAAHQGSNAWFSLDSLKWYPG